MSSQSPPKQDSVEPLAGSAMSSPGSGAAVPRTDSPPAHFVLVPMFAAGHAGPMLDMARALAARGALVTFVTTPLNLARLGRAAGDEALPIRFLPLRFPGAEAGLPDGCETPDALPGLAYLKNFHDACALLRAPLVAHLRDATTTPPASCVVSDACQPWTGAAARELGLPRLALETFCAFSSFCMRLMSIHGIFEGIDDDKLPVRVPGFPIDIEMSRARSPGNFSGFGKVFADEVMAENARADGLVINTFAELEPVFVDAYEAALGKKIWTVGPLFLLHAMPPATTTAITGTDDDADAARCVRWLDSQKPRSVVLVSFGSLARTPLPQLVEISRGLEASGRPFIWAAKPSDLAEFERWLSGDGLELRAEERWLPMATWPHFAEQFMNEKLAVDVLGVGVPVGVKDAARWGGAVEAEEAVVATRGDVERAVAAVMDGGEEGAARRERAAELGRKARDAVARGGVVGPERGASRATRTGTEEVRGVTGTGWKAIETSRDASMYRGRGMLNNTYFLGSHAWPVVFYWENLVLQ